MDDKDFPEPTTVRKMETWHIDCSECGHHADTYEISGDAYGILLGRSSANELAVLDAWKGKIFFDEMAGLTDASMPNAVEPTLSDCFRRVAGKICDPSPSGESYDFTGKKVCPNCKSPNIRYYADEPFQFAEIGVPNASHRRWDSLSSKEKTNFFTNKLIEVGCT